MRVYDTAEWFTGRLYSMIDDYIEYITDCQKVGDAFHYGIGLVCHEQAPPTAQSLGSPALLHSQSFRLLVAAGSDIAIYHKELYTVRCGTHLLLKQQKLLLVEPLFARRNFGQHWLSYLWAR
jgi:hypothetical protein